jgi:DNA-binding NtrC family response regulator
MQRLCAWSWPGNVRELRNCVEFLAATATGELIDAAAVERYLTETPRAAAPAPVRALRPIKEEIRELERSRMIDALQIAHGNQTLAAALIDMPLRTFVSKLRQYDIDPKTAGRADSAR